MGKVPASTNQNGEIMALDMSKVSASIKKYGEKLYQETQSFGKVGKGEYTLIVDAETQRVSLDLHNGYYAQVKEGVAFDADTVFTIVECVALRDASGEYNGKQWTVSKGKAILVARV